MPTQACTLFSAHNGLEVFAANNCNPSDNEERYYMVEPGNGEKYGALYFGKKSPRSQCGINEKGLFYAIAKIPWWDYHEFTPEGETFAGDIRREILQTCATLDQAATLLYRYKAPDFFAATHMLIADKNGACAIFEWDGTKLVMIKKINDFQIITNILLSCINAKKCKRYTIAEKIFATDSISHATCEKILRKTKQKRTLYTILAHLTTTTVYIYGFGDYDSPIIVSVQEELNKGPSCIPLNRFLNCVS